MFVASVYYRIIIRPRQNISEIMRKNCISDCVICGSCANYSKIINSRVANMVRVKKFASSFPRVPGLHAIVGGPLVVSHCVLHVKDIIARRY